MTQRTTPANTPRRRKIAIVAGKIRHPRALLMFEGLNAHYDVDIYAINHPDFNRSRELTSRIYLYEESPEMPGYLRGLEDRLVDADMVIGMETSCIATFQAIRAAARLGIPSGVVVNEFIPYFYSSFANIRAVQSDVLEKASFFWATSHLAAAALEVEGVAPERIARVELPVSTKRFRPSADSRAKFRDYIRLRAEERLVTFHGDLIPENQPERLLQATRVMRQMAPGRVPPLRLMFVGNGPHAESLKYQAHDMGLGSQILFLHQDPAPFLHDLYAATDAIIRPEVKRTDMHEDIPWAVLESMASGSAAIVVRSTITSELAGGGAIQADSSMHPHFSQALLGITASDEALARAKQAARQWIETRHHPDVAVGQIASDIERILAAPSSRDLRRAALESGMRSALEAIEENNPNDALVHVEDLLLLDPPAGQARGDILRVKGDALRALGKAEDAMDAYAKSLQEHPQNTAALRGLGFLSLNGHSHEESLTFFRRALALKDNDAQALFGIGLVHRRIGLPDDAMRWFERAVTVDPTHTAALGALTQTCAEAQNPRRAEETLERIMDVTGETPQILMALGRVYLAQGKSEMGNRVLQRALK